MPFYEPEIEEQEVINLQENLCVHVIASYNPLGECRRRYVDLSYHRQSSQWTVSIPAYPKCFPPQ